MTVNYKGKFYPSRNEIVKIVNGIVTLRNVRQDMSFTVSEEDLPRVLMYTWHIEHQGYVLATCRDLSRRNNGSMYIHQLLLGYPEEGFTIDHINRDKTDNTRSNLRVVSFRENSINRSFVANSASRFIGVRIRRNSFSASYTKDIYLCGGKDEIICAFYYDRYVALNYPHESTNFSLGLYTENELREYGVSSIRDIINFNFDFKRVSKNRFWCISYVKRGRGFFESRISRGSGKYVKNKYFSSKSERVSIIKRELFLDNHPDWITHNTKHNDLLSLFIPQLGQKFIIPRYVNDEGEVVECIL